MNIPVLATTGRRGILAGAVNGSVDRGLLVAASSARPSATLLVDLSDVTVITSSYVIAAFSFLWEVRPPLQPIPYAFANAVTDVRTELEFALSSAGVAAWLGSWSGTTLYGVQLVGKLDDTQRDTLSIISERGRISVPQLAEIDKTVKSTGWNNRLTALWQLGLLRRVRVGRLYFYEVHWKEDNHGRELSQEAH